MRSSWLRALLLTVLMAGCADETAILLEIDSTNLEIPTDVDGLRIRAVGLDSGRVTDRLFTPDDWPESLAIVPGAGSSREAVRITVWGRLGDVERVKRIVESRFVSGTTVNERIVLEGDCLDVSCPGETNYCLRGDCVTVMPPADGGVDMGTDPMDLGTVDMGMDPADMGGDEDLGSDPPDMLAPVDMFTPPDMPDVPIDYTGLIISEYVEPTSGNSKAIELYNGTGADVDLSACELELYRNGGTSAVPVFSTSAVLADGATFVFCHDELATAMPSLCDSNESTSLNHNGDDGFGLRCEGMLIDSFGHATGVDPGDEWTGGGVSTQDQVLRRQCPGVPDTDLSDTFDPSVDWLQFPGTDFSGLGSRSCPGSP